MKDYNELITRLEAMCACAPPDAVRVMSDAVSALEAQGRRLAEAEALNRAYEYATEVCDGQYRYALKQLAEAEALLREARSSEAFWTMESYEAWAACIDAFLTPPPAPGPGE